MNIFRAKRPEIGWTTISQAVFTNPTLSLEAMGLLAFLLSLPNEWVVRQPHLRKRFGKGKDKVQALCRELIAAGFMTRTPARLHRGRWTTPHYTVTDLPQPFLPAPVRTAA